MGTDPRVFLQTGAQIGLKPPLSVTPCSHCSEHRAGQETNACFCLIFIDFFFYKYRISCKSDSYLSIQQPACSSCRGEPEDTNVSPRNGLALLSWGSSYASTKPSPFPSAGRGATARRQRGKASPASRVGTVLVTRRTRAKPSPSSHPCPGGWTDRRFAQSNSRMQHNLEDMVK